MKSIYVIALTVFAANFFVGTAIASDDSTKDSKAATKKVRKFELNYGATVTGIEPGKTVRIWIPIAQDNPQQATKLNKFESTPKTDLAVNSEPKYGNKIGYMESIVTESGTIEFNVKYEVARKEAVAYGKDSKLSKAEKKAFLSANSLVPIDGKPLELLKETELPSEQTAAGALLYDVVYNHMAYDKSKPGYGTGNSIWACDSKTGNCTDFHSLFISLARSQKIPARFEIGFPLPADKDEGKIGGYHCWAWFYANGNGWVPVDISEADKDPKLKDYYFGKLTPDRVTFSSGRDIALVPASKSGPLNYFVYPHVEVDGKKVPKDKIKLDFSFKNSLAEEKTSSDK